MLRKLIIILLFPIFSFAQFYNGYDMFFGKNRVQQIKFYWKYLPSKKFDVYFLFNSSKLGPFLKQTIDKNLKDLEDFFGFEIDEKIIFIFYPSYTHYRQTNIGLQTDGLYDIGNFNDIIDNKIFIYFRGDLQTLELDIRKALAQLFFNKMIYGSLFDLKISDNKMFYVPYWFEKGLISFVAQKWTPEVENFVSDYFRTHKKISFKGLNDIQLEYLGHSFWYFIENEYGPTALNNILFFTKKQKSPYSAFLFVLGVGFKNLKKQWFEFYKNYYNDSAFNRSELKNTVFLKPRKKIVYQDFELSPNKKYAVLVTNKKGKTKIWLYNCKTGKKQKVFKFGHKNSYNVDYSFPKISWNYKSTMFAFTVEKNGNAYLYLYRLSTNKLTSFTMKYLWKINSFNFSPDNSKIVFSGFRRGYNDIYYIDFIDGGLQKISYDLPDDLNPVFLNDSKTIIFTSNRAQDKFSFDYDYKKTTPIQQNYDLFSYNIETKKLERITNTFFNETQPYVLIDDQIIYLSDTIGIYNRFSIKKDSSIAFIDTAIHYNYFYENKQVSNYKTAILKQKIKKNVVSEYFYKDGKFLYGYQDFKDTSEIKNPSISAIWKQHYKETKQLFEKQKKLNKQIEKRKYKLDSLKKYYDTLMYMPYDPLVSFWSYSFEREKDDLYKYYLENKKLNSDTVLYSKFYHPIFFLKDFGGDLDFGQINQVYQPFDGGPFYFNSGMSYFTKMQIDELFEDYRIIGGVRFALFNKNFEYLLSVENLKYRWDKKLTFYRRSYTNVSDSTYTATKYITNQLTLSFKYPFSEVFSFRETSILRYGKIIPLSLEYVSLVEDIKLDFFAGEKLELVFDNTEKLSENLYDGLRFKLFSETYKQINNDKYWIEILGADFRFYKEIFRHSIFATRFAASTSFGSGKLIYYLGGVNDWLPLTLNYFNYKILINPNKNYVFQAVATNMRGFAQNIRNGNSFVLINNEIRIPITYLIFNRKINSGLFDNLQLVGFYDVGTAWTGKSPWDKEENYYNTLIVNRGEVTVRVDVNRPPIVMGYGWGLRTSLWGYFLKFDVAWGMEAYRVYPAKFYISLGYDF